MADFGIGEAIAIAGIAASAAGTAVSVYSQYAQGQAQQKAAKYNQRANENAAQTAQQEATAHANLQRESYRRVIATNRAVTGSAGVEETSGSPLMVASDNARQAELNALMTEYGGKVRSTAFQNQAELYKMRAESAGPAGLLNAGSTLLSGAAQLGRQYGAFKKAQAPDDTSLIGGWG